MINAFIIAGDKSYEGRSKALIKIGDRYMVEYVIEALRNSNCIDKVYIIGDANIKGELEKNIDRFVEGSGKMIDNINKGIDCIGDFDKACLICTCDIPMVGGEAIRSFIEECSSRNLDLGYPIIDKKLNDIKYPEVQRTYVKLKEGVYTGGNIIYINPSIVNRCSRKAEELIEFRKNPLAMGKTLGITFLIRLLIGLLTVNAVENKIQKMFGIKASAIITSYPEIGNDVDKPNDIEFVSKYINKTV